MELDEYQEYALATSIFPTNNNYDIIYPALKLAGEAGEVAEKVGKVIRDLNGNFENHIIIEDLAKELGDVLWYVAALADSLGYSLSEIADMNLAKLESRKARNVLTGSGDNR